MGADEGRVAGLTVIAPIQVDAAEACFALAALLIAAAAVLGGASRENALRLATVELVALPLGLLAVRRMLLERGGRLVVGFPLALTVAMFAVPLLQLVPLSPSVWSVLGGHAPRVEALRLAHVPPPWLPLSLSPDETGRAALALIPPGSMFIAATQFDRAEARRLSWLWIGLASAGLVLGLAQLVEPSGGPAYPYGTTNLGSIVGLFANRNHEAGLLLALTPFAAALTIPARNVEVRRTRAPGPNATSWVAWPFIVAAIVALGVIRSRAGVILAAPTALAALAVIWRGRRGYGWPVAATAAAIGAAAVAVAAYGLDPILSRFDDRTPAEFRFEAWPHIAVAAQSFLPLGSGIGSFRTVFEAFEPLALVGPAYFNHAHNDYLELWLEAGWPGAAVLFLFLIWLVPAAWRAWRSGPPLAQAASAAIGLLMAQSTVDYPLRTETLAVLFAFCCGVLARRGRASP